MDVSAATGVCSVGSYLGFNIKFENKTGGKKPRRNGCVEEAAYILVAGIKDRREMRSVKR